MGLGARLPIALDAIPIVRSTSDRTARFADPDVNQRVQNLGTGAIERWNGASWVTDFLNVGNTTGTPAVLANDTQVLLLPASINFIGRVSGAAVGSQAQLTIPDLPILNANGSTLQASPRSLKFTGSGVSGVTDGGGNVVLTVSAGGGINATNDGTPVGAVSTVVNALDGLLFADGGLGILNLGLDFAEYGLTEGMIPVAGPDGTLVDSLLGIATDVVLSGGDINPATSYGYDLGEDAARWSLLYGGDISLLQYADYPIHDLLRRNGSAGSPSNVGNNTELGRFTFSGLLTTDQVGAYLRAQTDTPAGGHLNASLFFGASTNGAVADALRMSSTRLLPIADDVFQLGGTGSNEVFAGMYARQFVAHLTQPTTFFSFDITLGGTYPNPGTAHGSLTCGTVLMYYEAGNALSRVVHEYVDATHSYWRPDNAGIVYLGKSGKGYAGMFLAAITTPGAPVSGQLWQDSADSQLYFYDGSHTQQLGGGGGGGTAFFGTGAMGALSLKQTDAAPTWATKSGTTFTLTQDLFATTLDLDDSAGSYVLFTNGWRIFCSSTLTIDAGVTVHNGGNASTTINGGVSLSTVGTCGLLATNAGGNGTTGAAPGSPANVTKSAASRALTATTAGGAGGGYTPGTGNGSAGATVVGMCAGSGGTGSGSFDEISSAIRGRDLSGTFINAGVGGTGGPALSGSGGGGGGGGGIVVIAAKSLLNAGVIHADGGKGSNAVSGTSSAGGGGGSGGAVVVVYASTTSAPGTIRAAGGTGGTATGTYGAGAAGAAGIVYTYAL
jgi:hypothetical protein